MAAARPRPIVVLAVVVALLVVVVIGARVLGSRAATDELAAERERAAGFVNRLTVVNMLDMRVRLAVRDVDAAQWGRTPPDDEPPAGLEGEVIEPLRVAPEAALRPLRIEDGGGAATFTIDVVRDDAGRSEVVASIAVRSTAIEYCPPSGRCFEGYGWFDWQDAPDPPLDVFRHCVESDRVVGSHAHPDGVDREVRAVFQCDAARFSTALVLHR